MEEQYTAGAVIDHIVSLIVFLGALLVFIGLFNQTIQTAILYEKHRYLATKCADLIDNILLNPGSPSNETLYWGRSSCPITIFGLQDPESTEYRLNPFSLMRLLAPSEEVYYDRTDRWYSNVSWGIDGAYVLVPQRECINYSTATKLLGINGTFGIRLEIESTLNFAITESSENPLELTIQVDGQGTPVNNANITYLMFWANTTGPGGNPALNFESGSLQTNSAGKALKSFQNLRVDDDQTAYAFIVKTSIGGLVGVSYKSRNSYIENAGDIVPFIDDYENGTILLAHNFEKNPADSNGVLHFNATFYTMPSSFCPIPCLSNITGLVNYGGGKPYQTITIPPDSYNTPGFLVIAYRKGNEFGMSVMPWGIGTIGISVTLAETPFVTNSEWIVADVRQVRVGDTSYQAKLLLWSLEGVEVMK